VSIIIADASPLIALATIEQLTLLEKLYKEVIIPVAIEQELKLDSDMPGSRQLKQAIDDGWLTISRRVLPTESLRHLLQILDVGESEAILLTESFSNSQAYRFLLIDERKGRMIARNRGIKIAGTGAVLLAAKHQGYIDCVKDQLDAMQSAGYRLSSTLRDRLIQLAGESLG